MILVAKDYYKSIAASPSMMHQQYLNTRTFGSLDGIRALSIIAVVWHHSPARNDWAASARGFLGVDLFFVISGFLIVTLLLRERDRRGTIDLGAFYARRSLRIIPLNYAMILALWAATAWTNSSQAAAIAHDAPYALTYTANLFPTISMLSICWSLAAEEQFYLAWPLVERWFRRQALLLLVLFIAASLVVSCGYQYFGYWGWTPKMFQQTTFVPIALGVLGAHLLHNPKSFARIQNFITGRWVTPTALLAITAAISIPGDDIGGLPRLGIQLLMAWFVVGCVCREDHGLRGMLSNRILSRIGTVSYGIYLLHMIGLHVSSAALGRIGITQPIAIFAATLLLTWLLAEASFRTFERFFLRLKNRWSR
jgi:peptidoglycan/LPS O-acetylase OafA/YrhL